MDAVIKNMQQTMQQAVVALLEAKAAENNARAARTAAEEAVANFVGIPDEGSYTERCGPYKVTVKQPINRRLDQSKARLVVSKLGVDAPFRMKYELDNRAYKALRESNRSLYLEVAHAVTAQPGKVAVTIEENAEWVTK